MCVICNKAFNKSANCGILQKSRGAGKSFSTGAGCLGEGGWGNFAVQGGLLF